MKRQKIAAFTGECSRQSRGLHEFNPSQEGIFNAKDTTRRGTRRSGIESSVSRDREPIDVRANVTKPFSFFFLKRRGENRETTLLTSPLSDSFSPRNGMQVQKFHFLPRVIRRPGLFLSTCVYASKWSRLRRIFRCKCKVTFQQNPLRLSLCSFAHLDYGLMCACTYHKMYCTYV